MFNRLAGSAYPKWERTSHSQAHLSQKEDDLREATIKLDSTVAALENAIARSKLDAKEKAALEKQVKELAAETKRTYGSVSSFSAVSARINLLVTDTDHP